MSTDDTCTFSFTPAVVVHEFEDFPDHIQNTSNGNAQDLLDYVEDTSLDFFRQNASHCYSLFKIELSKISENFANVLNE